MATMKSVKSVMLAGAKDIARPGGAMPGESVDILLVEGDVAVLRHTRKEHGVTRTSYQTSTHWGEAPIRVHHDNRGARVMTSSGGTCEDAEVSHIAKAMQTVWADIAARAE